MNKNFLTTASVLLLQNCLEPHSSDFNLYWPISKILFISPSLTLVRVVTNNLNGPFQSGFRPKQRTDIALVKITNDLLWAADTRILSIFIVLGIRVALETISHTVYLDRLACFGSLLVHIIPNQSLTIHPLGNHEVFRCFTGCPPGDSFLLFIICLLTYSHPSTTIGSILTHRNHCHHASQLPHHLKKSRAE